jgi:thiol-disulfide isomerase/thioredoxin
MTRARWALVGLLLVATVTGCATSGSGPAASPLAACPTSTGQILRPTSATAQAVPDLSLPCLGDGALVAVARLGQPAVLNLWASWCGPCRTELPQFQRFADAAAGRVLVLGVVTSDTADRAGSLVRDVDLRFPSVLDGRAALQRALGLAALPATVLVTADGTVAAIDRSGSLDLPALTALVQRHLGISIG